MFSTKNWIVFGIIFIALVVSYVIRVVIAHGTWWHWFRHIWIYVLVISLASYFAYWWFWEWAVPVLEESKLPFFAALVVTLIMSGMHQAVLFLLK